MLAHVHTSHTVRGFCALCTAHCATIATVTDGKVVRLEADNNHPNGGVFCLKGKAAPELVYHPDRLNYPLKRTRPKGDSDPGWQRVSWEEALDDIAQRLSDIRERFGARAVALAKGTPGGTSVSDAERWLARFLNRFGSPNWTSTTHVCNWHKDTGFSYTFGVEIPTPDVAHSNAFLLWGHNPSATSLILAHDIVAARKRGMKIVAVDPRRVGIAAQADVLLQVRPGTDGALALALIDVAIKEKLYDDSFVRQWTNGPFLIRLDNGAALTEADLTANGSTERFVVWDEITGAPVIYDSQIGSYERASVRQALFGAHAITTGDGKTISCEPAFARLALLAAGYAPEISAATTSVPAEKVRQAAQILAANRPLRKSAPHPTADIHPETAAQYGVEDKSWMIVESPRGSIRAKARVTDAIGPGVVCCQHGWWQECKELDLPGYNSYGSDSANPSLLIGSDIADPISGSLPHRSFLCRVRPAE